MISKVGGIIIPILEMKKIKHSEVKELTQSYAASKKWSGNSIASHLVPEPTLHL